MTLLSVVQDVEFYISTENSPKILTDNTSWNNTKAKIIYGDLKLADGKSLTISGEQKCIFIKMPIWKSGKCSIDCQWRFRKSIFRGDRNDARYDTLPLNWGGIQLEQDCNCQFKIC